MKYRSFDSGILLCFQDFVFYILLLHRSYFIELILNFSGRSRCQETYDYVYCKTKKECRKQFVNTKCTAHRTDQKFPYKYHNAAADHSAESTLECGAFPEQCQQNKRSKGSTKACPCKDTIWKTELSGLRAINTPISAITRTVIRAISIPVFSLMSFINTSFRMF